MEVAEVIIYVILTVILISLTGVISWVIYDYYKYKDEQEIKLTNTFTKYKETDDSLTKDIKSSSNVLYTYSSNIDLNTSNYIKGINLATSNYIIESDKNHANNTSNYIVESNKKYSENTSNFNNNLSKYFKFGKDDNEGIIKFNNKLYEYTMWDPTKDGKLELINETTAAAGLRLKTTDVNGLNICDTKGEKCYNLYVSGSNLHIKAPEGGGDVKWGNSESVDSFIKNSDSPVVTLDDAVVTAVNLTATNATTAATAAATDADSKTTAANTATAAANTARATRTGITQAIRTTTSRAATNASLSAIQANNASISAVMSANTEGVNVDTKNLALVAAVKANNSAKLANEAAVKAFTAAM
jgi:hypothetical protein